jgi:hypothetical protein
MRRAPQANPPWRYEELVLAMDLYVRRGIVAKTDPEVTKLSRLLNALSGVRQAKGSGLYRNANAVHMKLANFRARDQKGQGLQHGNQLEQVVWDRFQNREDLLAAAALEITSRIPGDT